MRVGFGPHIVRSLGYSGLGNGAGAATPAVAASLQKIFAGMFPSINVQIAESGRGQLFLLGEFRILCSADKTQLFDFDMAEAEGADLIIDAISGIVGKGRFVTMIEDPNHKGFVRAAHQWDIGLEKFHKRLEERASLSALPPTPASIQAWLNRKIPPKLTGYKITEKQVSGSKDPGFTIMIGGLFYPSREELVRFRFKWSIRPGSGRVWVDYADRGTGERIIRQFIALLFPGVVSFDEVTMEKLEEEVNSK